MRYGADLITNMLASACRVCPLCICARRWPASRFAKAIQKIERSCPACKAYAKMREKQQNGGARNG